jgi:magnesium transporter
MTPSPNDPVSVTSAHQPLPGIAWFDVDDPASPALDELAARFKFHELQIEDCRHRPQRAKVEEHLPYFFMVLKHLHEGGMMEFDDVDVFVSHDFIVTVHEGESALIDKVRARAQQDHSKRVDRLMYLLVDTIVDEYLPVLDQLAEDTSDIEAEVLERPDPDVLARIFGLKRRLIEFRRITSAMREVVNAIMRREHGCIGDDLDPYFRDIYDHLVRTVELIETYRDLLTGSLDIYLSAVANRTNEVMKVLTVYGTIALPLVIITGFFGMNLHLPWAQSQHGSWYAVALMLISTVLILVYFKIKRWF